MLPAFCNRKKAIWPPTRMLRHSSAVSSNLAPAAALSPCFHLWMQQARGGCMAQHLASALQHIKGVFSLSAFLKSLFSSFLHVTSWKEITFWSLLAILFLELLLSVPQLPAQPQKVQCCCDKLRDGFVPIALRSGFEKDLY